eukprot:COSAG01_NODE_8525_length_2753_cov_3.025245_1_plen_90_part_10
MQATRLDHLPNGIIGGQGAGGRRLSPTEQQQAARERAHAKFRVEIWKDESSGLRMRMRYNYLVHGRIHTWNYVHDTYPLFQCQLAASMRP